jgi:hypothetical protein
VAALKPTVVAGHKKVENGNDPKIIGESQQYLPDFSRFADQATTPAGIVTGCSITIPTLATSALSGIQQSSYRSEVRLIGKPESIGDGSDATACGS